MPGLVVLIVYALAVARVTRLVTDDKLTAAPRARLAEHLSQGGHPMLLYLIGCRWCASVWISAIAAPLAYYGGQTPWLIIPALALAFSMITGLLSEVESAP